MTTMTQWGPARPPDQKICETCGFIAAPFGDDPQSVHRAFERHWNEAHPTLSRLKYREVHDLTADEIADGRALGLIPAEAAP